MSDEPKTSELVERITAWSGGCIAILRTAHGELEAHYRGILNAVPEMADVTPAEADALRKSIEGELQIVAASAALKETMHAASKVARAQLEACAAAGGRSPFELTQAVHAHVLRKHGAKT